MNRTFSLVDSLSLSDLQTFLGRAGRVEDGSVRLISGSGVLAVYVAVLYPVGLRDETPTVLGLRTFALTDSEAFDAVVPVRSLLDRLARAQSNVTDPDAPVTVSLPIEVNTVVWAAISPPRGGWTQHDPVGPVVLSRVADEGIREVADTVGTETGEQLVRSVRAEVWGRPIPSIEYVPAGAAFAAHSLGFIGDDDVRIYETGPWTRLTSQRGHVLVRRRAWTLQV
ncbi:MULTISPECIES: hypothetical protein [unclassified Cryobacterium]|uniref:hypothetical protein n=1 Tax=unclassified Cryobacterium TaxID=2649013 RepID=UPI001446E341|nr:MULTISPECIES: hypothetical protein [unclassified Cryobacterium]